jgi:pSer/pThr/pTyr-binding forkhead associated (FHA) protein
MLRLTVLEGMEKGRALSCGGPRAGLGTASDNELILSDPAVSRHHGALTLAEGRCT